MAPILIGLVVGLRGVYINVLQPIWIHLFRTTWVCMILTCCNLEKVMAGNRTDVDASFGAEFPFSNTSRYVRMSFMIPVFVLGVVGNGVLIVTILKMKFLRTCLNMPILNLAIVDSIAIGYIGSTWLASLIHNRNAVSEGWCRFNMGVTRVLFTAENLTITVIALSRYMKVNRTAAYDKWFTRRYTVIMCLCPWVLGLLTSVSVIAGHDNIYFNPAWMLCLKNAGPKWIIFVLLVIQYPITLFLYWRIYRKIRSSQRQVDSFRNNSLRRLNNASTRTQILGCFVVFLSYMFLLTPGMVLLSFFPNEDGIVTMVCQVMLAMNFSINCVVYGFLNKNVLRTYRQVLPTIWLVRDRDRPDEQTNG